MFRGHSDLRPHVEKKEETQSSLVHSVESLGLTEFSDSITFALFQDPVMTVDGHVYERNGIEEWFKNHDTSPLTNSRLSSKKLVPALKVKKMVEEFQKNALPKLHDAENTKKELAVTKEKLAETKKQLEALQAQIKNQTTVKTESVTEEKKQHSSEHEWIKSVDLSEQREIELMINRQEKRKSDPTSSSTSIFSRLPKLLQLSDSAKKIPHQAFSSVSSEEKKKTDDLSNIIMKASIVCGDIPRIKKCIAEGCDINKQDSDGMTPLIRAVNFSILDDKTYMRVIVELFTADQKINMNIQDKKGNSALHYAVANRNIIAVNLLLKQGASPHIRNLSNMTPYEYGLSKQTLNSTLVAVLKKAEMETPSLDNQLYSSSSSTGFSRSRATSI